MQIVALVVLVVSEEVSDGDNGDLIGVGNSGAGADACDNGGGVGDDGGSHFGVDWEGCVVGDAFRFAGVGVGNDGVGVGDGRDGDGGGSVGDNGGMVQCW